MQNISQCTLYVPINSVEAYQQAPVWKNFKIEGIEVNIEDPKSDNNEQLLIYPNPVTGTCSIIIPDDFLYKSSLTLTIYDSAGKQLQQILLENGIEDFKFQLEHQAAGVYPVVLSNGKKKYQGRVVFNEQ